MKKILHVIGARPNFAKAAPIISELRKNKRVKQTVVHTGQHFDENMSLSFLKQLGIGKPNYQLSLSSKTPVSQVSEISCKLEEIIKKVKPHIVMAYGDVNSALAAALVCKDIDVKLAHVEAGLRSHDKAMPEETNRIIIDHLSDIHFVTDQSAVQNLLNENISKLSIFYVGNTMIDSLKTFFDQEHEFTPPFTSGCAAEPFFKNDPYCVATFHRPSNVDKKEGLKKMLEILDWLSQEIKIIFPIHPRTDKNLKKFKLLTKLKKNKKILLTPPSTYNNFLLLAKHATLIVADSGGIQEEASYLNTPCLTLRKNTERPVTVSRGSSVLVDSLDEICHYFDSIKNGSFKKAKKIKFWDGKAAERIIKILHEQLS